ncbi:Uncharacterized protein APZ42_018327 [Daphnia magna]|uniref:Uncharacterized protein n=1 Tax=Daphnia magna TaxID=35525 RepID=A0A164Z446_9CRUS|nr:Uncharacterized protein APZ42_018327 [Daphnia magna]
MAYNFQHNKSPQPFGGRGKQSDGAASSRNIGVPAAPASPFRPASSSPLPMAPRMSAPMDTHAASPGPMMLRRQLLSPPCGSSASPQSSPCPSPVAGARLRPHSIALTSAEGGGGSPQQQLQHFLGFGSGSQSAFQPVPAVVRRQAPSAAGNGRNGSVSPRPASWVGSHSSSHGPGPMSPSSVLSAGSFEWGYVPEPGQPSSADMIASQSQDYIDERLQEFQATIVQLQSKRATPIN